jgi:hypothetical protein
MEMAPTEGVWKIEKSTPFQPRTIVRLFQEHSQRRRLFGIAIAISIALVIIVVFFSAVVFLFIVFLVGLLSHEHIGSRINFAGIWGLALMLVELLLKARLRINRPLERIHRSFKFAVATGADSECRGGAQPFDDLNTALDHVPTFLR